MLYVMASGQTGNIAPRGIVRVEILYSSLVELLVMSCKFFKLNLKKYIILTLSSTVKFVTSGITEEFCGVNSL